MSALDERFRASLRSAAACLTCDAAVADAGTCCPACERRALYERIGAKHAARALGLLPPRGEEPAVVVPAAPRTPRETRMAACDVHPEFVVVRASSTAETVRPMGRGKAA